jgi:hypothetical protein
VNYLLSLSSARRSVLFTCGWMITAADEDAIRQVPAGAWHPGTAQDGTAEDDKDVAEITCLMTRAGNWPAGCAGSHGGSSRPVGTWGTWPATRKNWLEVLPHLHEHP